MMKYDKNDAIMTQGMAILSMLCLHLFCRLGKEVMGEPLVWLNPRTPLVYWLGFFSEICVPTYTLCAGYAQQLLYEKESSSKTLWKGNLKRCLKLLKNYWIVLGMVCIYFYIISTLQACYASEGGYGIPDGWSTFAKSVILVHLYVGIWWYLRAYIVLLLLPSSFTIGWLKKVSLRLGISICLGIDVIWYILGKMNCIPPITHVSSILSLVQTICYNLIDIIPYFWIGALLCRYRVFASLDSFLASKITRRNLLLLFVMVSLFVGSNLIHKAVLMGPVAILFFLAFNLIKKSPGIEKVFRFLGEHSTNIWLFHPFFYAERFGSIAEVAHNPILILLLLLGLCIACSYLVKWIDSGLTKILPAKNAD